MPGQVLIWIIIVVLVLALWLISRAQRVDRLHRQAAQALEVLNHHLTRRRELLAQTLPEFVSSNPEEARELRELLATPAPGDAQHSAASESALSRWIRDKYLPCSNADSEVCAAARTLSFELHAARRFYNQQVDQVQRLRSKPDVTVFHLAGRAPMPETFDFDDEPFNA
ncbi:MAG: hypothetical protein Q4E01_01910 [Actinomycetaceae bacterium]|nr:hypothetical protein [Actinomycetaceae bacterium]